MKLITKAIEKKFKKYPLYSQDGKKGNARVVVKYFNPFGAGTWLITEGEKREDGDWLFYGLCHITDWEWGYVALSQLKEVPYIERDYSCDSGNCKVSDEAYGCPLNYLEPIA